MSDNKSANPKIVPGIILYGDVGYDMILPKFYEVISLTKSGKSARIRELETVKIAGNALTGICEPVAGSYIGEEETRRIKLASRPWLDEPYEYVTDGRHFFKPWDGKAQEYCYLD